MLIRLCTSQNDLPANSEPAALIDHSRASESVNLLKRTLLATDPETPKIMEFRTPWPMVVGQTLLPLAMAWFGRGPGRRPNQQTDQLPNPLEYKQIIWAVNLVRSTGAVIFHIIKIIKGGRREVPSIGEAIVFATVLVSLFSFVTGIVANVAGYIGVFTSVIGLLFYIASGILVYISEDIFIKL